MTPEFEKHVKDTLIPMMKETALFVSITPETKDKVDVKFALELGLAIMFDKPILTLIRPGTEIPEKLAKVTDRFVELDMDDPASKQRMFEVIKEMTKNTIQEED